jgi:hypothetical protein
MNDKCLFCDAKHANCAYGQLLGSQSCIDTIERFNMALKEYSPKLKFNWEYDHRLQTFVFGLFNFGGGVFPDFQLKGVHGECWYGNSVTQSNIINSFGPYHTKLEAQLAVEKDFIERTTKES